MKIKHYLPQQEVEEHGIDFCEMFFNKDENGYYNTIHIDTPQQKILLQNIEKTEQKISQYYNIIDNLKYQLQQLKEQYHILDN